MPEEKAGAGSRWHCSPLGPPAPLCPDVHLRTLQAGLKSWTTQGIKKIFSILYKLALVSWLYVDQIIIVFLPKSPFRFHISILYLLTGISSSITIGMDGKVCLYFSGFYYRIFQYVSKIVQELMPCLNSEILVAITICRLRLCALLE